MRAWSDDDRPFIVPLLPVERLLHHGELVLVALGILNTFGPAPASVEGMIYTRIPIPDQAVGYLEVVPQAFLFSALLFYWVRHPAKRWLTPMLISLFTLTVLLLIAGLLARQGPSQ